MWSVSMCYFTGWEVARILGSKGTLVRITLLCFLQLSLFFIYFTWLYKYAACTRVEGARAGAWR